MAQTTDGKSPARAIVSTTKHDSDPTTPVFLVMSFPFKQIEQAANGMGGSVGAGVFGTRAGDGTGGDGREGGTIGAGVGLPGHPHRDCAAANACAVKHCCGVKKKDRPAASN